MSGGGPVSQRFGHADGMGGVDLLERRRFPFEVRPSIGLVKLDEESIGFGGRGKQAGLVDAATAHSSESQGCRDIEIPGAESLVHL